MLVTGLRLGEMHNLKWKDINLTTEQVKVVQGKSAKDRILYVGQDMLEDLKAWRERQFKEWGETEYVFTTRNLKQWDSKAVRKMLSTCTAKAGIDKHVTPHT